MSDERTPIIVATVFDSFHGRLIVARLKAEGIRADLSGSTDGPYPIPGPISVSVPAAVDSARAKEILLGDEVDATFTIDSQRREPVATDKTRTGARALFGRWIKRSKRN